MVLYGIYRNAKPNQAEEKKLPTVVKLEELPTKVNSEVYPVSLPSMGSENGEAKDGKHFEDAQIKSLV